jgi:GDP-L-fucose synthase
MKPKMGSNSVLLTGGTSMIGRAVVSELEDRGYHIIAPNRHELDLLDLSCVSRYMYNLYDHPLGAKPQYCIHLAGWNGGIYWNKTYPYDIYYRTITMINNLYSTINKNVKLVSAISSCAYPDLSGELTPTQFWDGKSNETVECHGHTKRMFDTINRCLNRQFGTTAVSCIINNSFGPNDSFHEYKTKVLGAMIKKLVEAKEKHLESVTFWGTGSPKREFIFAFDAARGIVDVMESYNDSSCPINITSNQEFTMKELAERIAKVVGFTGRIDWDATKPDGQMRKKLEYQQIPSELTPFDDALELTIGWYLQNRELANNKLPEF